MRRPGEPLQGGSIRRAPVNRNPPPDSRGVRAYIRALRRLGGEPPTADLRRVATELDAEHIAQLENDVAEARELARRLDRGDKLIKPIPGWLRPAPNGLPEPSQTRP